MKCPSCKSEMIWDNDYSNEELGIDELGVTSFWHCSVCNDSIEWTRPDLCKTDSNVQALCAEFRNRENKGYSKYGTTTDREDLSFEDWLQHLKEELMDALVYLQKTQSISGIQQQVAEDMRNSITESLTYPVSPESAPDTSSFYIWTAADWAKGWTATGKPQKEYKEKTQERSEADGEDKKTCSFYVVCPAREQCAAEDRIKIADWVAEMERNGHTVYSPYRDDKTLYCPYRDAGDNKKRDKFLRERHHAINEADIIAVYLDTSEGEFYMDMVTAILGRKPILLINKVNPSCNNRYSTMLTERAYTDLETLLREEEM